MVSVPVHRHHPRKNQQQVCGEEVRINHREVESLTILCQIQCRITETSRTINYQAAHQTQVHSSVNCSIVAVRGLDKWLREKANSSTFKSHLYHASDATESSLLV